MPPPPPLPAPDTLTDSEHPVWQRADWFRAILFGALGVVYAVLLFPIAIAVAIFWLAGRLFDRSATNN